MPKSKFPFMATVSKFVDFGLCGKTRENNFTYTAERLIQVAEKRGDFRGWFNI